MENATMNSIGADDDGPEVQSMEYATINSNGGCNEVQFMDRAPNAFTMPIEEIFLAKMVEIWPEVLKSLEKHGLYGTLDPTTASASEPYIIYKAWGCIQLVSRVGCSRKLAISGLDGRNYHDLLMTGYQEGGLAAIHRMEMEAYVSKRQCVYKHLKALGKAFSCRIESHEDKDFALVSSHSVAHIWRFRNAVECCFLENIDPEAYAKDWNARVQNLTLRETVTTIQNLKI